MATPRTQTTDVAQVLADLLADVGGLRVYWYVSDTVRPPAAVIGSPRIDYTDNASGFCAGTYDFPITLITARSNDRDAQVEMSRLEFEAVQAVNAADPTQVFSIQAIDSDRTTVTVSGQELPGRLLTVRIKA